MERSTRTDLPAIRRKAGAGRRNSTSISWVQVSSLRSHPASPRKFKTIDERAAARIVEVRDVIPPLVIDADGTVLVGEVIYRAARRLGLEELPVMRVEHLSDVEALGLGRLPRGLTDKLHEEFVSDSTKIFDQLAADLLA